MAGMVDDLEPVPEAMRAAAGRGYSTATDLADWLVRELKMPFRDAHHVTGAIVKAAETQGVDLDKLPLSAMQAVEPRITNAVYSVLSVENSVKSRTKLWGNCATERRENGARLVEAVGKATFEGVDEDRAVPAGVCRWGGTAYFRVTKGRYGIPSYNSRIAGHRAACAWRLRRSRGSRDPV